LKSPALLGSASVPKAVLFNGSASAVPLPSRAENTNAAMKTQNILFIDSMLLQIS
jgi:hypothetical protein